VAIFGRLLTAMATPFRADGALDLDGAQRLAEHLVDHGSDGLVVAGTTGESPTLSHEETLDMFRAMIDAVGDDAAVVAGTGKNDTAATVALTREAAELGVAGILVVTPYYNKPSQRGLQAHLTEVAQATDLPVIVYDIPGRTACKVGRDTLLRVMEVCPNVRGLKDATKDIDRTLQVGGEPVVGDVDRNRRGRISEANDSREVSDGGVQVK
jgi:4-hydroxy-tetrahydrodipicolinate synthase